MLSEDPFAPYFTSGWREPWEYADAETTAARLERAGFSGVRAWIEPAPITFETAAEFRTFVEHVCLRPYLTCLPTQLHDAFSSALVDQAGRDAPAFTLDYVGLNLEGRKPLMR